MWLHGRDGDVTAKLGGVSERRGEGGGRGGAWRRAAVRSGITGREGKREPEEGSGPEGEGSERRGRGGAWRHRGVKEEAGGGQGKQEVAGAASAPATHLFVLLAEAEDDKGEEVGWAGQMGWPAGPGKWRQVTCLLSLFYFFLLFCFI